MLGMTCEFDARYIMQAYQHEREDHVGVNVKRRILLACHQSEKLVRGTSCASHDQQNRKAP